MSYQQTTPQVVDGVAAGFVLATAVVAAASAAAAFAPAAAAVAAVVIDDMLAATAVYAANNTDVAVGGMLAVFAGKPADVAGEGDVVGHAVAGHAVVDVVPGLAGLWVS